jgi:hypothetical protein
MRQTNPIHRLKACCSTHIACFSGLLTFRHCFCFLYSIWFPSFKYLFYLVLLIRIFISYSASIWMNSPIGQCNWCNSPHAVFFSDARTLLPSSFQFSPIRVPSQLLLPESQQHDISCKSQTQIFQIIFAKALKGSKVQRMLQRGHGGTFSDPK